MRLIEIDLEIRSAECGESCARVFVKTPPSHEVMSEEIEQMKIFADTVCSIQLTFTDRMWIVACVQKHAISNEEKDNGHVIVLKRIKRKDYLVAKWLLLVRWVVENRSIAIRTSSNDSDCRKTINPFFCLHIFHTGSICQ